MKPIGPLMAEHTLIEHILRFMDRELQRIKMVNKVDTEFLKVAVDFLKTYTDRCHHGKEEDILFRNLKKKNLSQQHRAMVEELVREHGHARRNIIRLAVAKEKYLGGDYSSLEEIAHNLHALVVSYPRHIEKEDKFFFRECMGYFTPEEQAAMLAECREFDRKIIHEKYITIIRELV